MAPDPNPPPGSAAAAAGHVEPNPTVGRIVHVHIPHPEMGLSGKAEPSAAIVTKVWQGRRPNTINAFVLSPSGEGAAMTSIPHESVGSSGAPTWCWPPRA